MSDDGALKYEPFNAPEDGLTKIEEFSEYGPSKQHHHGWTMVGIARARMKGEDRLFGVYCMTKDESLRIALEDVRQAKKELNVSRQQQAKLERQLTDVYKRIAELEELLVKRTRQKVRS